MKILITGRITKEGLKELNKHFEVIYAEDKFTREEVLEKIVDCHGVMLMGLKGDKELIDAGKNLKIIAGYGVGYDNIDIEYAKSKNIIVSNVPKAVLEPTAELAFALILATTRKLTNYDENMKKGNWMDSSIRENMGFCIYGSTLGIFGMGRIGQSVARRAKAFGMNIIYHNRTRLSKSLEKELNAEYVDFDTLLKISDVISINAPLTESTRHKFNKEAFFKMKKTSYIVNTARGALIDENALIEALKNKKIAGAGLDVFETEPLTHSELFSLENVVLTPHVGTACLSSRINMAKEASDNIISFLINNEEKNVVNR